MADAVYKVGDKVKLKSGGPTMTVQEVTHPFPGMQELIRGGNPKSEIGVTCRCQWFVKEKLVSGEFPEESLQPASPDDKAKKS
jgi:uncharacterized protein YodC (DUF2158 family)